MSYQYPPTRDDPEIGASQTNYMSNHLTPITPNPESKNTQMSPARRRDSFSREFKLKRSVSTPNVRPQGTTEVDNGTSSGKRRNKLGYHRTPIACEHCRKRKIRCKQPESPDVLGRCESCINLQRECIYSAITQLQPPHTAQRLPSLASPSTSPAMPAGHSETQSTLPYQLATIPDTKSEEEETYSSEPRVSPNTSGSRAFHYEHGTSSWMPTGASANFSHGLPETADYSSYGTAPTTTSPLSPSAASMSTWPSAHSLELSRINTYPTAGRSVSYGDDQAGTTSYAAVSPTRSYDRRHDSLPDGSLSAGAAPGPHYGTWTPQPYQYAKPHEGYDGWYGAHQHSPEYYGGR